MKHYYTQVTWPQLLRYNTMLLFMVYLLSALSNELQAQCNDVVYQVVSADEEDGPTLLSQLNLKTGVRTQLASINGRGLNSIGYSSFDNKLYGLDNSNSSDKFVSIGLNGAVTEINIPNLPVFGPTTRLNSGFYLGDATPDGYYVIQTLEATRRYFVIDLDPSRTATYHQLVDPTNNFVLDDAPYGNAWISTGSTVGLLDFAYDPITKLLRGANATTLFKADIRTGVVTTAPLIGLSAETSSTIGAVFQDSDPNRIFVYANQTGNIYTINTLTNTGSLLRSSPYIYTFTDGASCPTATLIICGAGTTPPTPSAVALEICPSETANLTTLQSGTLPAGTVFAWHSGTPGTNANLIANPSAVGAGTYYLTYFHTNNVCYSPTSAPVIVSVKSLPAVTPPASQIACVGGAATFTASASGTAPFTYQWLFNGTPLAGDHSDSNGSYTGSKTANLTITPIGAFFNGAQFSLRVTNSCGTATSDPATLTINTPPTITTQPGNGVGCAGATITFTGVASGATTYQWVYSDDGFATSIVITEGMADGFGGTYTNVGTPSMSHNNVSIAGNNRVYKFQSFNGPCLTSANVSTETVTAPPTLTVQPAGGTGCVGSNIIYTGATTTATSYQWYYTDDNLLTKTLITEGMPDGFGGTYTNVGTASLHHNNVSVAGNNRKYLFMYYNGTCGGNSNLISETVTAPPSPPTFTINTVTPLCPVTTFNLNLVISSSSPGSILRFYTSATPTPATLVADPTVAPVGTYYAFYTNGTCTSPASASIIVKSCSYPVTLVSFSAIREGSFASLKWATTEEINADRFEIQSSTDAKEWATIGTKNAAGDSKTLLTYNFMDTKPATGLNYYRLKMIDRDATFAYSSIRSLKIDDASNLLSIYPNPVSDVIYLDTTDLQNVKEVLIMNVNANTVYKLTNISNEGISVKNFINGIYTLKVVKVDGSVTNHKIVIMK